jgi:uncharacterized protein YciI
MAAAPGYTLVLIKTGPMSGKLDMAANDAAFAGHFENMGRLAKAEQLVVAGPFGKVRHDPDLRGIFVLATAERAEAERWASTDPTTQAGVFVLEYHDLATDAPLVAALRADSERRERLEAAGTKSAPGDGARAYVLLFAEHGDVARRELAPLCTPEGGVYLVADLDGTRAFALLDAGTQAEAAERFAPQLEAMGSHALSEWFASDMLARMVEKQVEPSGKP